MRSITRILEALELVIERSLHHLVPQNLPRTQRNLSKPPNKKQREPGEVPRMLLRELLNALRLGAKASAYSTSYMGKLLQREIDTMIDSVKDNRIYGSDLEIIDSIAMDLETEVGANGEANRIRAIRLRLIPHLRDSPL